MRSHHTSPAEPATRLSATGDGLWIPACGIMLVGCLGLSGLVACNSDGSRTGVQEAGAHDGQSGHRHLDRDDPHRTTPGAEPGAAAAPVDDGTAHDGQSGHRHLDRDDPDRR